MILLWGLEDDSPMRRVRDLLRQKRADHLFINHADILDTQIEMSFNSRLTGTLHAYGEVYPLENFQACYLRPYDFREFPHLSTFNEQSPQWKQAIAFEDIFWTWTELTDALVLNRPGNMQSNNSKPWQCSLIEKAGFKIPDTLITTDTSEVARFRADHSEIIYKSISSQRSIVSKLSTQQQERLEDIRWCPTQFQQYVPGDDYRVHVVGEQVFASVILSDKVDYRYGPAQYEPVLIPDDIAGRCVNLSQQLGLVLSGIDLRKTPDGEWYCFETNPSPAYSCYESGISQPISNAISELLIAGRYE